MKFTPLALLTIVPAIALAEETSPSINAGNTFGITDRLYDLVDKGALRADYVEGSVDPQMGKLIESTFVRDNLILQEVFEGQKEDLDARREMENRLNTQIIDDRTVNTTARKKLADDLAAVSTKIIVNNTNNSKARADLADKMNTALKTVNTKIDANNTNNVNARAKLASGMNTAVSKIYSRIDTDLEENLIALEKVTNTFNGKTNALNEKVESNFQQTTQKTEQLDVSIETAEQRITDTEQKITDTEQKIKNTDARLNKFNKNYQEYEAAFANAGELNKKYDGLNTSMQGTVNRVNETVNRVNDNEARLNFYDNAYEEFNKKIELQSEISEGLQKQFNAFKSEYDTNNKRLNAAIAGVTALSLLPQPTQVEKVNFAVGVGHYMNETAAAIGFGYSINEYVTLRTGASYNSTMKRPTVGAAIGWTF